MLSDEGDTAVLFYRSLLVLVVLRKLRLGINAHTHVHDVG
jgi:hypothetical protein